MEIQGAEVSFERLFDDDEETVFDQYEGGGGLDGDDILATSTAQDRSIIIEDDSSKDGEKGSEEEVIGSAVGGRSQRKRTLSETSTQEKRSKIITVRQPLRKLNVGVSQSKSSSFATTFLDGMKAKADCM
ncbi:hypothetical protein BGZ58_001537 [Dissophora ornata]|nr:hypothetical protein BGZ58_001537 [Dissophora ornata]